MGIRVLGIALALICMPRFLPADDAIVKRNVNLRADPSSSNPPMLLLKPPDRLKLLEAGPTNGYLHVETADFEEGWVWANNVEIVPSLPTAPPAGPGPTASSIDTSWSKPTPNQTTFNDSAQDPPTCGPTGDGTDVATNSRKNRTDSPSDGFHDVEFASLVSLPMVSGAPRKRDQWTQAQKDVLVPDEGVAVRVVGYIVAIKVEDKSRSPHGESTNCHWTASNDVDWHMALVASSGLGEKDCVVVETTPRIRKDHPKWTPARLGPWLNSAQPVRISGWVMYDPDHPDHLGKYRQTLWEVHPVMQIEVLQNDGTWVALDDLH
jgi:hypothetical protein